MHVMERVVEKLGLVPGESKITVILKHAEMVARLTEQGPIPSWNGMNGVFKDLIFEEGEAVLMIDVSDIEGVLHQAISVSEIASISHRSEITSPSLK
jgi:hypothetical protein